MSATPRHSPGRAGRRSPPRWVRHLRRDPLPALAACDDPALTFMLRRDLLDLNPGPVADLWSLPTVENLVRKQRPDGAWAYPGGGVPEHRATQDYDQLETYRNLGILVEKFAATRRLPAVRGAAELLFSRQTEAGDFRGIYGRQYTPNYSAGILELLVKAGYGRDRRVQRAFAWLLGVRQADGGWAIPMVTRCGKWHQPSLARPALAPDRTKPSSHMVTGVVLRAFAAHPRHRRSAAARQAGHLLASRLFARDAYPGRDAPEFWTKITFPFWFTDLLSALDSLTRIGLGAEHPKVAEGLAWLAREQGADGVWRLPTLKGGRDPDQPLWITLAVCRVFQRAYGDPG